MRHFATEKFKAFLLAGTFPATALERYNGHANPTASGKKYCVEYADLIIRRAEKRNQHVGIEIKLRK